MQIFENMDCMEGMKRYHDKYFDLAIVDPPYGIGENASRGGKQYGNAACQSKIYTVKNWDDNPMNENFFEELIRVSKDQIIFGANHFISKNPIDSSCWIVWDKNNIGNCYADCELAWTSFKTAVRIFRYTWNGMIQENMKNKENRIHPTQKPVDLYKWLIKNYAKEGMKILDTHVGSASSLIAFESFGLDYVGFEIDKEYFEKAKERIEKERDKLNLFNPSFEY